MRLVSVTFVFIFATVIVVLFQNCSNIGFYNGISSGLVSRNGSTFDGMTSYFQTRPNFTCSDSPSYVSKISNASDKYFLTVNTSEQCKAVDGELLEISKLSFSSYNPDYIGYGAGIYLKSEVEPDPLAQAYDEAWCQPLVPDSSNGLDVAVRYDDTTKVATAQIYFATTTGTVTMPKFIAPFPVMRSISESISSYAASDFSLTIDRAAPGPEGWDFSASLTAVIDGLSTSRKLVCRVAGLGVWTTTLSAAPISARADFSALWTGGKYIVWGGDDKRLSNLNDGGIFDPFENSWRVISPSPLSARSFHSAVWTGTDMIVWGGRDLSPSMNTNTGAAYDPQKDSWKPIAVPPLLGREQHASFWTGKEMFIWGGTNFFSSVLSDGALYNPKTNLWAPINPSPLSARAGFASVWTGNAVIVWGGVSSSGAVNDGALYDPVKNNWKRIASSPLSARAWSSAVWTGKEMIIWAGNITLATGGVKVFSDGAKYDPLTDSWKPISSPPGGYSELGASTVWTGKKMVVWGGLESDGSHTYNPRGLIYDSSTDKWIEMNANLALGPRSRASAVWAGSFILFWGGVSAVNWDTGGSYTGPAGGPYWYTLTFGDGGHFVP